MSLNLFIQALWRKHANHLSIMYHSLLVCLELFVLLWTFFSFLMWKQISLTQPSITKARGFNQAFYKMVCIWRNRPMRYVLRYGCIFLCIHNALREKRYHFLTDIYGLFCITDKTGVFLVLNKSSLHASCPYITLTDPCSIITGISHSTSAANVTRILRNTNWTLLSNAEECYAQELWYIKMPSKNICYGYVKGPFRILFLKNKFNTPQLT